MSKTPRDISGIELCQKLGAYGYVKTRQVGSHVRMSKITDGISHHITVPAHDPIKIGTMSAILSDVSKQLSITKNELIEIICK